MTLTIAVGCAAVAACLAVLVATTFLRLVFIHAVSSGTARQWFVTAFVLPATVFTIALLEALGVVTSDAGAATLTVLLRLLLVWAAAFLPYVTVVAAFRRSLGLTAARLVGVAAVVGAAVACTVVLSPCTVPDDPLSVQAVLGDSSAGIDAGDPCDGAFDGAMARAAVLGVVFVGALSGFAAVATPASYLLPFLLRHSAMERHLVALQRRQRHVVAMWAAKQRQLALATYSHAGAQEAPSSVFGRLRSAAAAAFDGSGQRAEQLRCECGGYQQVALSLFLQTDAADEYARLTAEATSVKGLACAFYGVILSCYCVLRLCLTSVNLALGRFSVVDPVTRAALLAQQFLGVEESVLPMALGQVGLLFNGAMILLAVRGFLVLVFRLVGTNRFVTPEVSLLAFATCMALYFLGTAVLLRLSLPAESRAVLVGAIGSLPFQHYHRVHDAALLVAAVGTAVVRRFVNDGDGSVS